MEQKQFWKIAYWDYEIDRDGNVRSLKEGRGANTKSEDGLLAQYQTDKGLVVSLSKNGEVTQRLVHQLVWETFYNEYDIHLAFIDGDKYNPSLDNLIPRRKMTKILKQMDRPEVVVAADPGYPEARITVIEVPHNHRFSERFLKLFAG